MEIWKYLQLKPSFAFPDKLDQTDNAFLDKKNSKLDHFHDILRDGLIVTLQESSSVVRDVPGESDGARRDLAHSDGRGHWRLHHLHAVADAVLPVQVLHGAHHAGQVLRDGGDQQGAVIEDLRNKMFLSLIDLGNDGQ